MIIPFDSSLATLENAGGKGANLARLTRAGFNVPPGFILSTGAYRAFVAENNLEACITEALSRLAGSQDGSEPALELASRAIRGAFSQAALPGRLREAILAADGALQGQSEGGPLAVRSSATTEDLPDLSFAGQQDTFLNVTGPDQLLRAVVDCWSSLWTARAIGYRQRNAISHTGASLAVVVQQMVPSEVSGVLFTANPLSGLLSETVIDATFGLGEALVSGQVEPDHFVYDVRARRVTSQTLGAKGVVTRARSGGGVETLAQDGTLRLSLSEDQVRLLADTGQRIQAEYGSPQDIEWAIAGGQLYILQSRAITSLFPVPEVSYDPLLVWFSFGAVQGMLEPMTPLGQDAIMHLVSSAGQLFNVKLRPDQIKYFAVAGERLWVKISNVMRHPLGARIIPAVLPILEPSTGRIIDQLDNESKLGIGRGRFKFRTMRSLAHFFIPALLRMVGNVLDPQRARQKFDNAIEQYLSTSVVAPGADRFERLENAVDFMENRISGAFPFLLPQFIPLFGPSMASLIALGRLAGRQEGLVLEVTRGLPGNVTTEMDLALWSTASAIRADEAGCELFLSSTPAELARQYHAGTLPPAAQSAVERFMQRYGMRGVGEIDLGKPRWREDPTPVMHTLHSYLQIDPSQAPDVLFDRGAQAAERAVDELAGAARRQPLGWLKEKLVRAAARRIRLLMGARESPKFFAIRTMGTVRAALLETGKEFVEAGTLDRPDDLFFLTMAELRAMAGQGRQRAIDGAPVTDWKAVVTARRATHEREQRRRQVPRVLTSDGRAFYEGVGAVTDTTDALTGSPVSPGVVEGRVHIIFDPRGAHLAPGEILVCPGTDPAWTPLFMAAGGLVTEVGGMMTHGSVVAREVGIPAVVGVHQATQRLKNGQMIRVDGSTGKITIMS